MASWDDLSLQMVMFAYGGIEIIGITVLAKRGILSALRSHQLRSLVYFSQHPGSYYIHLSREIRWVRAVARLY
ncbi:MAG: hypothetical protein GPOALKHO_000993 [Sodalis sp.]|nr:MAG: hypothetical protein GPOALKHO_000993 [Sodalis sp.]